MISYSITFTISEIECTFFISALSEIARVTSRYALMSLPHFGPGMRVLLKIPFLPEIKFSCKIPWPQKHIFNGQHYWEIGKKGFPVSRIREELVKIFTIKKEFIPFENQYHHFFILEKK